MVIGVIGCCTLKYILNALLTDEYRMAADYFNWYYWTTLFLFLSNFQSVWEVLEGHYSLYIIRTLCAAVINIGLNYLLVPIYGVYGAIVASLIAFFVLSIGMNVLFKSSRKYLILQKKSFSLFSLLGLFSFMKKLKNV